MMETKTAQHTPGPWEIIPHGAGETADMTIREDKTSGQYVALVQVFGDSDFAPRARANAALIAAAPETAAERDRLRAENAELRGALEAVADMRTDQATDHHQLSALCVAIARAALAKGAQP